MFFGKDESRSFHFGMSGDKVDSHLMQIPFLFRKISGPSKVLDIGCTGSPVALQLAMLRYNVTGIDYNDYGKQHANLNFIKGDFIAHDFGKEKFDIVVAINSLEHFGLQHYNKSEYLDKQNDVKAMTKVKEIMNRGGQLIFSCNYGISDLIAIRGKPFARVYDDKALDVMLSTFDVKSTEYYIISDSKTIRQAEKQEAQACRYYLKSGSYAFACISAVKL